ncbi:MFS transporter [Bailinhaonella thermotolerans]|uniref:MFS transporter n=1 Tax=Bailinhaonella thermotolerans TaxID=1070861 RepID=A0A3A4B3I4_9ACTN|nr:MFS transporter [Bailinhaonella thermotolerans]RJL35731.1 MFS transporter [Bailinhaonella thermotolerans]
MKRTFLTLVSLCLSIFVVGTAEFLVAGLLPQIGADLGVSVAVAGQAVTAYALGTVIAGPLVAIATVRLPRKGLMLALMAVFAAGSAVSALAPSYPVLLAGRVITAIAHATFFALTLIMATRAAPAGRTGTAIAAVTSGLTVATLLGVPLGAALGQEAGWRLPFAVLAGLGVACLALLAFALPRVPGRPAGAASEIAVLARRPVLLSIATTAVGFAGVGVVFTYLAPTLNQVSGFAPSTVSLLLVVYGLGSLLGNLVTGRLADRAPGATLRGVFACLTVLLAVMPFAVAHQAWAAATVLGLGLLATATVAPLQSLILQRAGSAPTLAVTVNVAAFMLAHAVGSAIGAGVVTVAGLRWTGVAGAVLSACGLLLSYLAAPRRTAAERQPAPGGARRETGHVPARGRH